MRIPLAPCGVLRYTRRVRVHRILNAVLGAAIVAELIVLIGHPLFGWGPKPHLEPVTPPPLTGSAPVPPSAREALLQLSAVAAHTALNTTSQTGRYAYVELQTWRLADQTGSGRRPTEPLTRVTSTWRAANGAGREVTVRRTLHGYRTVITTLPAAAALPSLTGDTTELAPRLGIGPAHLIGHRVALAEQLATLAAITAEDPV
jgi:hypothetical protein